MADETLSTDISGANGLPAANPANLDADNTFLPVDDNTGETVHATPRQITDAVGDTNWEGDVAGVGKVGETITLAIQADAVTLAMLAHQTPNRFLGFNASGVPVIASFGAGMAFDGSVASAAATTVQQPGTNMMFYQRFGLL